MLDNVLDNIWRDVVVVAGGGITAALFTFFQANVKRLPKPIAIQSVLNAGSAFYFGVFLLNTLDLTTDPDSGAGGLKNVWYHVPNPVHLYLNECSDDGGSVSSMAVTSPSPIRVRDYNETVLRYLFAFYSQ